MRGSGRRRHLGRRGGRCQGRRRHRRLEYLEAHLREEFPRQRHDAVAGRLKVVQDVQAGADSQDTVVELLQKHVVGILDSAEGKEGKQANVRLDKNFDLARTDL